jgi:ADP-ribose pyrophosphatase YjhB (NUDIX family)
MDEPVAAGAVLRPTVRVLLVDGTDRVLLFRMHPVSGPSFWAPPGGGVDPGESDEQTAVRELREETGWRDPQIGPFLGNRRHVVTWNDGVTYDSRERWYLARVDVLDVAEAGWTDDERLDMSDHRWWTLDELRAAREEFVPPDLAGRVMEVLGAGPPEVPWTLGG